MRTLFKFLLMVTVLALPFAAGAAELTKHATLFKNPECGCCEGYAAFLRANGYAVTVKPMDDLTAIKRYLGVPEKLESCHTMLIDGYAVEGHVPLNAVNRLLAERPPIKGIALPGMPLGSPGMNGRQEEPFVVYEFSRSGIGAFDVQ